MNFSYELKVLIDKALRKTATMAFGRSDIDYRKIVFISYFGLGYLGNPKYVAEAVHRLFPGEFDLVFLVNGIDDSLPSYIRQVRKSSPASQYELATARVWIDNCRARKYVKKRDEQVYINTWHCSIAPKRVEADVEEHLGPMYVRMAKLDGQITDLMFADNSLYERVYRTAFWYNGPVIRCGVPRNRPLILGDHAATERVREAFGISRDTALCLYAPTFRANFAMEQYQFDFTAVRTALEKRFGKKYVLAYRLHPNIAKLGRPSFLDGLIDATNYPDAQELLVASDVCISDYSSILEDFAFTGRPGFVYAPDFDSYMDDRGIYYSFDRRPFPVAMTSEELVGSVAAFNEVEYASKLREFYDFVGMEDNGYGDETIATIIKKLSVRGVKAGDIVGR